MKPADKPCIYFLHGTWRVTRSLGNTEAAQRFVRRLNRLLNWIVVDVTTESVPYAGTVTYP